MLKIAASDCKKNTKIITSYSFSLFADLFLGKTQERLCIFVTFGNLKKIKKLGKFHENIRR
jgi:hypothetical protein